eukprot:m.256319 g.256319  ORF g.256319 m.256319 type:complete len:517 (-) comp15516_c0_seq9:22-1572(-)
MSWFKSKAEPEPRKVALQISKVPTVCESQKGHALAQRLKSLPSHGGSIGPVDACIVTWSVPSEAKVLRGREELGEFHYVSGADTSSQSAIATYMRNFIALRRAENKNAIVPVSAIYCTYDMILQCDIHVEMFFPSRVKSYTVTASGRSLKPLLEKEWQSTWFSGIVRGLTVLSTCESFDDSVARIRVLNPLSTPAAVQQLEEALASCLWDAVRVVKAPRLDLHPALRAVSYYFRKIQQDTKLLSILAHYLPNDPLLSALIARNFQEAEASTYKKNLVRLQVQSALYLSKAADATEFLHASILAQQAELLLNEGKVVAATKVAQFAVTAHGADMYEWITLSKCLLQAGCTRMALAALNQIESVVVPKPLSQYKYAQGVEPSEQARIDQQIAKDHRALHHLPAAQLGKTARLIYKLLATFVRTVSWTELLKCRQEVSTNRSTRMFSFRAPEHHHDCALHAISKNRCSHSSTSHFAPCLSSLSGQNPETSAHLIFFFVLPPHPTMFFVFIFTFASTPMC